LLRQAKADDVPTSYLWGYGRTLPIAEVVGADTSQIAYSGFESTQSNDFGKWAYSLQSVYTIPSNVTNDQAKTGRGYFSGGNLSSPTLPAGNYVLSTWARYGSITIQVFANSSLQQTITRPATGQGTAWVYLEVPLTLPANAFISVSVNGNADDLRLHPAGALMTTYTHAPLIGLTSTTDPNGVATYYEYDDLGRLRAIRDQDGNLTKTFQYNYKTNN
ncbi:MAG: YD repeat-containing protein, partial [Bernardetiaceae bacterium]|nr:YD repeat-containing protein [Bernardetiaceae bacterium]